MSLDNILKEYSEQTRNLFASRTPGVQKDAYGTGVAQANQAQLFYVTNGLFADATLDATVINATIQPTVALANMLPVVLDNREVIKWSYITGVDEGADTLPDEPCDFGPSPGGVTAAYAFVEPGRYSVSTSTIEIDQIIRKANRGVHEDLYLLGTVRGVSAMPTPEQLSDRAFVQRAAVRRQMMLAGRKLQRTLLKAFWQGDPSDAAQNTVGGGRKAFLGLDIQISADYGTLSHVSGTNKTALNSVVYDWDEECVNTTNATLGNIYEALKSMEYTLWSRANHMGLLPVTMSIVMRPELWYDLLQVLPCQALQGGCSDVQVTAEANTTVVEIFRQNMASRMELTLNGRTYPIVLDDFITGSYVNGTAGEFTTTSTIYFVPMVAAGETMLYWSLMDYRLIDQQLAPVPGAARSMMAGWTDSGRFHHSVGLGGNGRCFKIDTKIEPALVLKAPQLAGKIIGVNACLAQRPAAFVETMTDATP